MNEVEKMQASANKVAVINTALTRSASVVLSCYGALHQQHDVRTARRYLASLCATVIGCYIESNWRKQDAKITAKLIEIELGALGFYIANNGDDLLEIDEA